MLNENDKKKRKRKEKEDTYLFISVSYTVESYSLILSSQRHNSSTAITISHKGIDYINKITSITFTESVSQLIIQ